MQRFISKVLVALKNPKKFIKLSIKQFYILFRFGPFQYLEYLKRATGSPAFIHNFPNGIKTTLDTRKAKNWHLLNKKPLVVVLLHAPENDISLWVNEVQKITRCHFLIGAGIEAGFRSVDNSIYTTIEELSATPDLYEIKAFIHQSYRGNDVMFFDLLKYTTSAIAGITNKFNKWIPIDRPIM